ncbi:hypothetical protein Avbf_12237 [Armadillidium vulgare]|nr:hypothetical protein Avbf_12237 [Armadillidium vulgare]
MDIGSEVQIKIEVLDGIDEDDYSSCKGFEKISESDEIQERKPFPHLNIKDEIETKDEPLKEDTDDDEQFEQISAFDESQISDKIIDGVENKTLE